MVEMVTVVAFYILRTFSATTCTMIHILHPCYDTVAFYIVSDTAVGCTVRFIKADRAGPVSCVLCAVSFVPCPVDNIAANKSCHLLQCCMLV